MINKKIAIENCMTETTAKYLHCCDTDHFPTEDEEEDDHLLETTTLMGRYATNKCGFIELTHRMSRE